MANTGESENGPRTRVKRRRIVCLLPTAQDIELSVSIVIARAIFAADLARSAANSRDSVHFRRGMVVAPLPERYNPNQESS